ncbi:MAG: GNAT family N-acetyltransferase [Chloroflexota bacterium]
MATLSKSRAVEQEVPMESAEPHSRPFDALMDMGEIADLVEVCFADTLDEGGRRYLQRMHWLAEQPVMIRRMRASIDWVNAPTTGYVWQQDGKLVGNVSLIPYFVHGKRFFLIANVAVHPDYRRQGIARSLTERAIEHARRRRVSSIWLHVREENDAAISLYRSQGFSERARRTHWVSLPDYTPALPVKGLTFRKPRASDWEAQHAWLLGSYPAQVTWHLPFSLQALRPGLLGLFYRLFISAYVEQWAAYHNNHMLGTVAWQALQRRENFLWLAAPLDADEVAMHALLVHARRHAPSQRPLMLDYPAGQFTRAIQEAGFWAQQTLIWMEMHL